MNELPKRNLLASFLYVGQLTTEDRFRRFERMVEIFTWTALILGLLIIQLPFAQELNKGVVYLLAGGVAIVSILWHRVFTKIFSGKVRSFIFSIATAVLVAFLVHNTGGAASYIVFLYFLVALRVGLTLPIRYAMSFMVFVIILIFGESFFAPDLLAESLSLSLLNSIALALVVFFGRFFAGEALLAQERQEKITLDKEKTLGKLKDEFVFIISKELKQPTTAIKGYVEKIFSEHAGTLSKDSRELLDLTDTNANRLSSLLNDLLDVSRIEKEGLKVAVTDVIIGPIVSEVLSNQLLDANKKRISISQQGDLDIAVNADVDRLKEVLTNLVNNAIKYTPEGGKVVVSVKNEGEFANVSISDNGFGISGEDQKHLFEKFYRIENEQTKSVKGSGLGLFITKNLIEKMGGEIGVKSKIGEGTTFSFKLPRYRW